jgi:predicted HTH domain antitoxin
MNPRFQLVAVKLPLSFAFSAICVHLYREGAVSFEVASVAAILATIVIHIALFPRKVR